MKFTVPEDTKPCQCGEKMIVVPEEGVTMASMPPQQGTWWKCYGCGRREQGPVLSAQSEDDVHRARWARVNNKHRPFGVMG